MNRFLSTFVEAKARFQWRNQKSDDQQGTHTRPKWLKLSLIIKSPPRSSPEGRREAQRRGGSRLQAPALSSLGWPPTPSIQWALLRNNENAQPQKGRKPGKNQDTVLKISSVDIRQTISAERSHSRLDLYVLWTLSFPHTPFIIHTHTLWMFFIWVSLYVLNDSLKEGNKT